MPLRVGFDLDGTVADMHAALRDAARALFGTDVSSQGAPDGEPLAKATDVEVAASGTGEPLPIPALDHLRLTPRQRRRLWDHVMAIENFWTTLPELEPGVIARIARTATERRWEVIFLTMRPSAAGDMTQRQSQQWLDAHGFQYPSVMVVQGLRGRIVDALQLDAFVDDRIENCHAIALESKATAILVWPDDLKNVHPAATRAGVRPVGTIAAAIDLLEEIDDARQQSALVRSIRRVLRRGRAKV